MTYLDEKAKAYWCAVRSLRGQNRLSKHTAVITLNAFVKKAPAPIARRAAKALREMHITCVEPRGDGPSVA